MVRTTVHTCKECDKNYKSYQSLCNHRTKKHKVQNNSIEQHNNSIQQHNNSIEPKITAIKSEHFNCRFCDKSYKHQQSRSRHEIICKTKNNNSQIIETQNNNSQIIETQNNNSQIIETQNIQNNTNNGTINNTTIILNNFNEEKIEYLKNELMKNTLIRLTKHDDNSLKHAVPKIAQFIHFNPFHKENNNLEINSMKSKIAKKYVNGKWIFVKKEDILKEVHTKIVDILQKWIDSHRLELTRAMMNSLKDYKLINPEYLKKIILEEINLLGYLYYKNHMEEEEMNDKMEA